MAYDVPVRCGDVLVRPVELVFTDFDGIVVVPQSVEAEVFQKAAEKASRENVFREELFQGHSLRDVFNRHGAL